MTDIKKENVEKNEKKEITKDSEMNEFLKSLTDEEMDNLAGKSLKGSVFASIVSSLDSEGKPKDHFEEVKLLKNWIVTLDVSRRDYVSGIIRNSSVSSIVVTTDKDTATLRIATPTSVYQLKVDRKRTRELFDFREVFLEMLD